MKTFKITFLLIITLSLSKTAHAQVTLEDYNKIAGDSACFGTELKFGTNKVPFWKGLNRIFFNESVKKDEIRVVVRGKELRIESRLNSNYVEFDAEESGEYKVEITTKQVYTGENLFRLYWFYSLNVKEPVADFNFTDINGVTYSKESLKGKVVVMNFWGLNCRPCLEEIPDLNQIVRHYKDRPDVVFLAISGDKIEALKDYSKHFQYTLACDINGTDVGVKLSMINMLSLPTHIILDKDGNLVFRLLGSSANIKNLFMKCIDKHI